ncbi:MAG: hypothetical protein ACRDNS_27690 [Trebonia sp.]
MTNFPATKLTELVDPIAYAWRAVNPRHPFPEDLGGPGGVSRQLPDLPGSLRDKPLIESQPRVLEQLPVQTPAPAGDAELGPGKFLGKPCPHGHRVRYEKTKACVACLRAAVKRSTEKRKAA